MKTCPDCDGDGVAEKGTDEEQQCLTCGGRGFVPDDHDGQEEVINTRHRWPVALTASQGVSTQIAPIQRQFILFRQVSFRKHDGQRR